MHPTFFINASKHQNASASSSIRSRNGSARSDILQQQDENHDGTQVS
jgi:hypothetical protein